MDFKLNELQQDIRDTAREFAQKCVLPRVEEIENAEAFPQDIFEQMRDMGLLGIPYPEEIGGIGGGYLATAVALEEIARVSASAATLLTVCYLPLDAFHLYANEEQVQKYLVPGIAGEYRGSFAFTEPDTGSDPKQLTTIARKEGDKYLISGCKRFISNAAYDGPMVVFAKEKETEACTAFIIQKGCKGYSLSKPYEKCSLQGSHVYDVFLDDVEVSENDILGAHGQGFDILIGTTAYGKLAFSAVFTGTMVGSYDMAVQYAKEKTHRGTPIGAKFSTVQSRIAQLAANVMSAKLCLYKAASDADEYSGDIRKIQCSTALVKGYISDLAVETNVMALNVYGAYGVCKDFGVERMVRDSLVAPNIEGAADIQRIIAGSYIIRSKTDYFD